MDRFQEVRELGLGGGRGGGGCNFIFTNFNLNIAFYSTINVDNNLFMAWRLQQVLLQYISLSYVYWTVHHLDSWIKRDQLDVTCFIISLFNMYRMLIHPSSGAWDLFVDLFHGLYCSGSMCVGVTLWFGWGGVVSVCRLKHCFNKERPTWCHLLYYFFI